MRPKTPADKNKPPFPFFFNDPKNGSFLIIVTANKVRRKGQNPENKKARKIRAFEKTYRMS
jgi:hypothetical protein